MKNKFEQEINRVLNTLDEADMNSPQVMGMQAPTNGVTTDSGNNTQQVVGTNDGTHTTDTGQEQQQGQPQEQTPEEAAFAIAQTPPENFEGIDVKDPKAFELMLAKANEFAQTQQQGTGGEAVNPTVASNPTTVSAQPAGTTPVPQ